MTKVFYSAEYVGSSFIFDTTRKSKWIADSLVASPIPGVELAEPAPLTFEEVSAVHDAAYVVAVRMGEPRGLAQSQGFEWDPGLWRMVLASNGGVVAAAHAALEHGVAGSLSSGLHHARREAGGAFCTFNGLAIAARRALAAGARSVLIIDVDAHGGGGTASLIADEPRIVQIDLSVNGMDAYSPTARAWPRIVRDASTYLATLGQLLERADREQLAFDLCLYNAGMDPFEGCLVGGLAGITAEILAKRERMVFEWCRGRGLPVAFVLAGGYKGTRLSETQLVDLHRLTIAAAATR